MLVVYKDQKYNIPPHKWACNAGEWVLLDEHEKPVGRVVPYTSAYRTFSGEKEFGISETLEWAKAVVLMETFHPGSIGADAWY